MDLGGCHKFQFFFFPSITIVQIDKFLSISFCMEALFYPEVVALWSLSLMQRPEACLLYTPLLSPRPLKQSHLSLVMSTPSGQPSAPVPGYISEVLPFSHSGLIIFLSFYQVSMHLTLLFKNILSSILKFSVL